MNTTPMPNIKDAVQKLECEISNTKSKLRKLQDEKLQLEATQLVLMNQLDILQDILSKIPLP